MKLFKKGKISYANHGRPLGWGSSPDADWKVLFLLFLLVLLISASLSVRLFFLAKNADLSQAGTSTQINISRSAVKLTADLYTKRALDFKSILSTKETGPDPSI